MLKNFVRIKSVTHLNKIDEVMNILSEECAEVIQAISKCNRFGLNNIKPGKPKTNLQHLEEELGDLLAMIDILHDMDVVSWNNLEAAKAAKIEKLKKWSSIYETESL
jgi:NTP pyrophosphatase (non-canonical NTP hydrolase)